MQRRPMIKRSIASIRAMTPHRPPGYFDDVMSCGVVVGDAIEFEPKVFRELAAKYRTKVIKNWPAWARAVALLKSSKDKGVGDTIQRLVGDANSASFKAWHQRVFGRDCGCARRQAVWNRDYPY